MAGNSVAQRVCAKHKWRGDGECPSCAGERAANESFDRLKPPVHTGESE